MNRHQIQLASNDKDQYTVLGKPAFAIHCLGEQCMFWETSGNRTGNCTFLEKVEI